MNHLLFYWKSLSCAWIFVTHSPWNSPGQNTGVGSLSLTQGIFPTQVSHIAGWFFTSWATREAQEYWSGLPIPSLADLPKPGIELGSPAFQAGSLPTELSGKSESFTLEYLNTFFDNMYRKNMILKIKSRWKWEKTDFGRLTWHYVQTLLKFH